jgi:eukaryotic-like serine/threonine-protein kinase
MTLTKGTRLGPYEIVTPLGAGGMGEVYRARDPRIGRDVAIKILSASRLAEDQVRRFQQEARAAGALNHPNIVAVFDVGEHDGVPYVVSELLEGRTLREHLREGPLRTRKATEFAIQVADGLAAAHERGIYHRDLKPANLFITHDQRVKILDFGLARLTGSADWANDTRSTDSRLTDPGIVLGTAGYMSPEQIRGHEADHRADIFSFGAVLYEMLSGKPAFSGPSTFEAMGATLKDDARPLSESGRAIPLDAEEIVRHCLEKDPTDRFQSARDLAFDLRRLLGQLSGAGPAPAVLRSRRTSYWLALSALAVLAAAGAAVITAWARAKPLLPSFERVTFHRGTVTSARFGPHEQAIVYSAAWEGRPSEVYVAVPPAREARALGYPGARLLAISSSGEMALAVNTRYEAGERFVGTLATLPWSGGTIREVLEDVEEADWSPDGSALAVVRSAGGRARRQLEYPIGTPLYLTTGDLRQPRVSPQGRSVAFLEDPADLGLVASVAVVDSSGRKTTLTAERDDAHGLAWSPDGSEVWFTARDGGERALLAVSLAGRERVLARAPGSLELHDVAADGRILVTREDERDGILALPPGGSSEIELSWLGDSGLGDLAADGKSVLFGDRTHIYLRRTDGSVPARLGDGFADSLSPNGKWALTTTPGTDQLVLVATGAGQSRSLPRHGITAYSGAWWFPDGDRIVFNGREAGRGRRAYVQEIAGGPPRPLTPEGTWSLSVAPDGSSIVAISERTGIKLYPTGGGQPVVLSSSEPGDRPGGWTKDGRALWVFRRGELPACVHRIDLTTGDRRLWKCLRPHDAAGVQSITDFRITPDGTAYAYGYRRVLSDLYVMKNQS